MASNRRFYEIDVALTFDGATCKNPDVQFEKPSECLNVRCEYSDSKILVEIPTDCSECVYAIVTCNDDDCAVCNEPQRISICPCDSPADCGDCEDCVNGMCVSICDEDEFCSSEGICVECDDENPCANNQVCVSGDCQCPPDKPILNDKGVCVACDENHPCPACTYCTPDGCKPIVCPTGTCNPDTGECVECNGTGDCTKPNECCVDNKCDCCKGFKRDYATGECVPEGCIGDGDCEECEICYKGTCIPRECPEGYICVGDDCVPECDCSKATCDKTSACVSAGANKCYCKECTGNCSDNTDCGVGCICDGNGKCIPNPCKGGCNNGTDCGPGCGCDSNGDCVPCDSYSCNNTECENILGCGCTGTGCKDITGCDGPCSSSYDCGPDCTCYKGKCVPCADFPCSTGECADHPNCVCNGTKCEGDGNDGDGDGCTDVFTITKDNDNCDLIADLVKEEGCSCSPLTIDNKVAGVKVSTKNDWLLEILVELRKGEIESVAAINTIPLLGDTSDENIADNEKPTSGVVEIIVTTTYKEVDANGAFVKFTTGPVKKYSGSMVNKDSHTFPEVVIQPIGKEISDFLFVHKVEVEVRQATDFTFPNNCTYIGPKSVNTFTITKNEDIEDIFNGNNLKKLKFAGYEVITSSDDRYPMLVWYRSDDGTYSSNEIIRKIYVPETNGSFTDTLYGLAQIPDGKYPLVTPEGELWSGKYFSVKNDCSCEKDADAGKVVFCNPDELFYELDHCNKEITLLRPFSPCDVNQDITKWNTTGYNIPAEAQVEYDFYLNGEYITTFVHDKTLGSMVKSGSADSMFGKYTASKPITEIKLVMNHDDSNECTLIYQIVSPEDVTIDKTVNCAIAGDNYQVTIPKVGTDYTINSMTSSHGTVISGSNSFVLTLPKGVTTTLSYNLASGCTLVETSNEDCCDDFEVTLVTTGDGCGSPVRLSFTNVGGMPLFSTVFTKPDGSTVVGVNGETTITNPVSGTYSVTVTDANGCTSTDSKNVTVTNAPVITYSGYSDICAGDSTSIIISSSAEGIDGILHYTANGNASSILIGHSGLATIGPISTAGEYVFTSLEVNGCTFSLDDVITIAVTPETTVVVTVDPVGGVSCSGSNVTFSLSGGVAGCAIELVSGGVVLATSSFDVDGNAQFSAQPETTTVYTIRAATSCTISCLDGLPYTQTITVVPGSTISVTSESCDVTLTNRTLNFDNIDSATDQLGNNLTVIGNSVTVNPNTVSSVNAVYNDGICTVTTAFAVSRCPCPDVVIELDDEVINSGESVALTPVISGGSGSYAYAWSTGQTSSSITVSPTTTTSYTLVLTDNVNGCVYSKVVTVIVVSCTGGLDAIIYQSCVCDGDCTWTFRPTFLNDYAGCKVDEGASDIQVYIDGSGSGITVDISDGNHLDFIFDLSFAGPCPDPTTIRFAGTLVFLDEIGNSCCDGVSISIDDTQSRPGGGWGCTGC